MTSAVPYWVSMVLSFKYRYAWRQLLEKKSHLRHLSKFPSTAKSVQTHGITISWACQPHTRISIINLFPLFNDHTNWLNGTSVFQSVCVNSMYAFACVVSQHCSSRISIEETQVTAYSYCLVLSSWSLMLCCRSCTELLYLGVKQLNNLSNNIWKWIIPSMFYRCSVSGGGGTSIVLLVEFCFVLL